MRELTFQRDGTHDAGRRRLSQGKEFSKSMISLELLSSQWNGEFGGYPASEPSMDSKFGLNAPGVKQVPMNIPTPQLNSA